MLSAADDADKPLRYARMLVMRFDAARYAAMLDDAREFITPPPLCGAMPLPPVSYAAILMPHADAAFRWLRCARRRIARAEYARCLPLRDTP